MADALYGNTHQKHYLWQTFSEDHATQIHPTNATQPYLLTRLFYRGVGKGGATGARAPLFCYSFVPYRPCPEGERCRATSDRFLCARSTYKSTHTYVHVGSRAGGVAPRGSENMQVRNGRDGLPRSCSAYFGCTSYVIAPIILSIAIIASVPHSP